MKRILLLIFVLLSLSQAKASDTLTVRQVFNFSVGDTFDYIQYLASNIGGSNGDPVICYTRKIITGKSFAPGNNSVTYICSSSSLGVFCNSVSTNNIDSFSIGSLDSLIYNYDTSQFAYNDSFYILSSGLFFDGRLYNNIEDYDTGNATFFTIQSRKYIAGLGLTTHITDWVDPNPDDPGLPLFTKFIDSLIYFSDSTETFGTPYYIWAGINDLTNTLTANVYPNPTSGNLHLSISAMDGSDYHLILTDILGQQVYSAPVTQSERTFDISKLSTGIYTWRLEANEGIIKTGKVVKE